MVANETAYKQPRAKFKAIKLPNERVRGEMQQLASFNKIVNSVQVTY